MEPVSGAQSRNSLERPAAPLLISFYYGDEYYHRSALQLQEDCKRAGMEHYVVEAALPPNTPWVSACRYKVPFIADCLRRFRRPLLWLDADCRLLARPDLLWTSKADLGFFLRGFRYLKDFDPMAVPRLAQPSILYFGYTSKTLEFVEIMASLESEYGPDATDDFFLHEAWRQYQRQLSLLVLPPDLVCFELPATGQECFFFGRSNSASEFKSQVDQHEPELYGKARRKAVLLREARDSLKSGDRSSATVFLHRAYELDPSDEALAYRVARLLKREGKVPQALELLKRLADSTGVDHVQRFLIESAANAKDFDRAGSLAHALISEGCPSDAAWAQSRLFRIGLEMRARAKGIEDHERLPLSWMERPYPGNFGDLLAPYIVERLSGRPPRFIPKGKGVLAIGSIIKFAREGSIVWGTGTSRMSDRLHPKAEYRAVRGPLTRRLVLDSGGKCPPVYGDPSAFLPHLYQPARRTKRYALGFVAHHAHIGELQLNLDVRAISVLRGSEEDIEAFIDELHECERVLTTSLHGLIVAHAYGIPARWCDIPDATKRLPGDGTKFRDYLLSVGLKPEPALQISRGTAVTPEFARHADQLPERPIDLEALLAAAPFKIEASWNG